MYSNDLIWVNPWIKGRDGSPVLEMSIGFWSWSRVLVSQPAGDQSHSRLPVLSIRHAITSLAAEHHQHWPVPNYTAWWQRHVCVCEQLVQGCTRQRGSQDSSLCWSQVRLPNHAWWIAEAKFFCRPETVPNAVTSLSTKALKTRRRKWTAVEYWQCCVCWRYGTPRVNKFDVSVHTCSSKTRYLQKR